MHILGVNAGHDASAALVVDGEVVAHVAEERFPRIKHCERIPFDAINYCLQHGDISSTDLSIIATEAFPEVLEVFHPNGAPGKIPPLDLPRFPASVQTDLCFVDHHLSHAASAYCTSGCQEKVLVVTCDGIGGGVSAGVWRGEGGELTKLAEFHGDASIGWFFESVTEALGWWSWDGAGKTMGLAPYGDYSGVEGILDKFCPKYANGHWIEERPGATERSMMYYRYKRADNPAVQAARLLAEGKIVGWFQGRMESGPRALGGRSILMSPLGDENKDILNARVKYREAFRPFCPSMTMEHLDTYLQNPRIERFMLTSFDVTEEKKSKIPAVVHVDGTTRPQTVSKSSNPLYWELIDTSVA